MKLMQFDNGDWSCHSEDLRISARRKDPKSWAWIVRLEYYGVITLNFDDRSESEALRLRDELGRLFSFLPPLSSLSERTEESQPVPPLTWNFGHWIDRRGQKAIAAEPIGDETDDHAVFLFKNGGKIGTFLSASKTSSDTRRLADEIAHLLNRYPDEEPLMSARHNPPKRQPDVPFELLGRVEAIPKNDWVEAYIRLFKRVRHDSLHVADAVESVEAYASETKAARAKSRNS